MRIIAGCCFAGPFVFSQHTLECLFCADWEAGYCGRIQNTKLFLIEFWGDKS